MYQEIKHLTSQDRVQMNILTCINCLSTKDAAAESLEVISIKVDLTVNLK